MSNDGATTYGMLAILPNSGSPYVKIDSNGIERLRIDSAGYVGIGTSIPTSQFQVTANGIGTSGTILGTQFNMSGNPGANSSADYRSLSMSFGPAGAVDYSGNLIGAWYEVRPSSSFTGNITNTTYGSYSNGLLLGSAAPNFGTIANVVGLRTLPVNSFLNTSTGTITNAHALMATAAVLTNQTVVSQSGITVGGVGSATNNTHILIGTTAIPTGNFSIYNQAASPNYFNGSLGVGTTAPGEKLQVNGNIRVPYAFELNSNGNTSYNTILKNYYDGTYDKLELSPIGNSRSKIGFFTSATNATAPTEVVTIAHNGRVGIGSTVPTVALDVNGVVKATGFSGPLTPTSANVGAGTNGAPSLSFSGDDDTGFYNVSSNNTISVAVGGAKIFDFTSTGFASPTTGGAKIGTGVGTTGLPTFSFAGDLDTGWWSPLADTLAASTGGVERIRIGASGNIGIGTVAEDYAKFHTYSAFGVGTSWGVGHQSTVTIGGSSAIANGVAAIAGYAGTYATGAGYSYARVFSGTAVAANDAKAQTAEGAHLELETHAGDTGYGLYIASQKNGNSTGGSQTGLYINLDDVDITNSYGVYQASAQPNFFAGNIGIGTNSPSSKLQVNDGDIYIVRGSDTPGDGAVTNYYRSRGTVGARTAVQSGDNLAEVWALGHDGSAFGNAGGMIIEAAGTWTGTSRPSSISFWTVPSGDTLNYKRLTILDSGYVGIGTGAPQSALQVKGYTQLDTVSGAPPGTDCDAAAERGRMKVDPASGALYVCMNSGWVNTNNAAPAGSHCGGRQVACYNTTATYEQDGADNVTCSGNTLTATCVNVGGYYEVSTVSGCPTGYSGKTTYTGNNYDSKNNFFIYCAKN